MPFMPNGARDEANPDRAARDVTAYHRGVDKVRVLCGRCGRRLRVLGRLGSLRYSPTVRLVSVHGERLQRLGPRPRFPCECGADTPANMGKLTAAYDAALASGERVIVLPRDLR